MDLTYVNAHCDNRVLHAPGCCKYCDAFPDAQLERIQKMVCFTEKTQWEMAETFGGNELEWLPCPAEAARGLKSINGWGGNVAMTPERERELDEYWADFRRMMVEEFGLDENEL